MKFYIVDAFTETVFGGNPAGVVIIPDGADFPDDETMRKTAAELRYSETAFIKKLNDKEFNIRYFTPAAEVDLCGHATIGSFVALADAGLVKAGEHYTNHTLAGTIGIDVGEGSVLMDMAVPQYINEIATAEGQKELYEIMGLSAEGQGEVEGQYLIPEMISTGLPDIMMPVKNEEELAKIAPDFPALSKLSERYEVVGVHAFTVNTEDGAVHCRNFAPLYDIDEEAATGTSNGALTYYLYRKNIVKPGVENAFIQGEAMDRPSKINSK
ncbi:MAG: PhzF family phenazine biosynthesis protein, partial [Firmicutes bacterium]|nr:PhzF family phenazine biosynthesis protein [Bacillota bacterium]